LILTNGFRLVPHKEIPRRQAAHAIAICIACPARAECPKLALQHWYIGHHGVWGGHVVAERAAQRRQRLSRTKVPSLPVPIVPCHHSSDKAKAASRPCVASRYAMPDLLPARALRSQGKYATRVGVEDHALLPFGDLP
jgi:hypothetical protein